MASKNSVTFTKADQKKYKNAKMTRTISKGLVEANSEANSPRKKRKV